MTRVARDVDQAPVHLAADPIAGVSFDHDPPAGHLAAQVPARVAVDVDLPVAHPVADEVHAGQVSLEVDPPVGRIAGDGEQLGQRQLPVAVEDLDPLDLGQRLVAQPVGDHALDLDGDGGLREVSQRSATSGARRFRAWLPFATAAPP